MGFRKILVGVDGSGSARRATDLAVDIAQHYDAAVVLLHVVSLGSTVKALENLADYERVENLRLTEDEVLGLLGKSILSSAEKVVRERGVRIAATMIEIGDPAPTIMAAAREQKADLIIIGRRGLGDIAGLLLGSVSHKIIQLADRPCLTVG